MNQNEFLDILMRDSPQELNAYIEKKGKRQKSILAYDIIDPEKYEKKFIEKGE